eukprot:TRINITY_DN10532_c0_g2_i1.p1 TRINITY_DN10532_c0_g2~~TRINITY_DN10532_c0_g2_i1.p1  ORF type:complete len:235 (-),score=47.77 TRINITY_DN10532_c0_g2_i1:261-965(-)
MEASKRMMDQIKLTYFPLMAKGLGPSIMIEFCGIEWEPNQFKGMCTLAEAYPVWLEMRKTTTSPFGQLPMLEIDGQVIGQATAICCYLGHKGGMLGKSDRDYAVSSMLLQEGEDIWTAMKAGCPTCFAKEMSAESYHNLWEKVLPAHLSKLQPLLTTASNQLTFSPSSHPTYTVGEAYLFSMLYQARLVNAAVFEAFPSVVAWLDQMAAHPAVVKVLEGKGPLGVMEQYFIRRT